MKDMTELETIKITVEKEGKEPEVMETKSLLILTMDPEGMATTEVGTNVSPDLLAIFMAHMELENPEEGKSAIHDAMKRLPKWRRWVRKQKRKDGVKELRKRLRL